MNQGDKAWVPAHVTNEGGVRSDYITVEINESMPHSPCLPEIARVLLEMTDGERELLALKVRELRYINDIFYRFAGALESGEPRKTDD